MLIEYILHGVKDNVETTLSSPLSIAASSLNVDDGTVFPAPINGSTTSLGDSITLNATGIGASGIVEGDFIENITDGSHAYVISVSTNSLITTPLKGGAANVWGNGHNYVKGRFVVTVNARDINGNITSSERILINNVVGNVLTVGERGYDGDTPNSFDTADYVNLFVVSSTIKEIGKGIAEQATDIEAIYGTLDLQLPTQEEKDTLPRLLDFDLSFSAVTLNVTVAPGYYDAGGNQSSSTPLALTPSSTNYVEIHPVTGVVSFNTGGFTTNHLALWEVITDGTGVTAATDRRQIYGDYAPAAVTLPEYTAGENISGATTPQPLCQAGYDLKRSITVHMDGISTAYDFTAVSMSALAFGNLDSQYKRAQSFTQPDTHVASNKVSSLLIWLSKVGSPTDNLSIEIMGNDLAGGDKPDSVIAGTSDVLAGSSLGTYPEPILFEWSTPAEFTAGAKTWWAVRRSAAIDAVNYYNVYYENADNYPSHGRSAYTASGASWSVETSSDILFQIVFNMDYEGKAFLLDISNPCKCNYIGIACDTVSAGGSIIPKIPGRTSNEYTFPNSEVGRARYAQSTPGTDDVLIPSTDGYPIILVSKAFSSTSARIVEGRLFNTINHTVGGSSDIQLSTDPATSKSASFFIPTGIRPEEIELTYNILEGTAANGGIMVKSTFKGNGQLGGVAVDGLSNNGVIINNVSSIRSGGKTAANSNYAIVGVIHENGFFITVTLQNADYSLNNIRYKVIGS